MFFFLDNMIINMMIYIKMTQSKKEKINNRCKENRVLNKYTGLIIVLDTLTVTTGRKVTSLVICLFVT